MKKIALFIIPCCLLLSCKSHQFTVNSLYGSFHGVTGKSALSSYIFLELNKEGTCLLTKSFDLYKIECVGEWNVINNNIIEIKCNRNPVLCEAVKALIGGGYTDGGFEVKVLNKNKLVICKNNLVLNNNKLNFDNIVLKRKE